MSENFYDIIKTASLGDLIDSFPITLDFMQNLNLPPLPYDVTLEEALLRVGEDWLEEFGITRGEIPEQLASFLGAMTTAVKTRAVSSLTIFGGRDKDGNPEDIKLTIDAGSVVSIVGPTGSGKSQLLADIECLAQGDTPTRRVVHIDGMPIDDETRFSLDGKIVAQLSQNMNFVMDLSVREFLEMHARSRLGDSAVITECFECANRLAGEKFDFMTKVTQLSGGQSRALMIADCAYISRSPIVLIDEIENAGVDRRAAVSLLARREKIVLISTHDPLLALEADKRIIIRNGGISKVLETTGGEKLALEKLARIDETLTGIRAGLRAGERIDLEGFF